MWIPLLRAGVLGLSCLLVLTSCRQLRSASDNEPATAGVGVVNQTVQRSQSLMRDTTRQTVLLVRGVFATDGQSMRRRHPLRRVQRVPSPVPVFDGRFRLRVTYTDSHVVEIPFDAYEEDDSNPGRKLFGGFSLEIPVDTLRDLESIVITDPVGTTVFSRWTRDEIPKD